MHRRKDQRRVRRREIRCGFACLAGSPFPLLTCGSQGNVMVARENEEDKENGLRFPITPDLPVICHTIQPEVHCSHIHDHVRDEP